MHQQCEWKYTYAAALMLRVKQVTSVVKENFDKVVGHLFIDSMSLVTQEVPPWLVPSCEISNLTCSGHLKLPSQTPSSIFLSSVTASNW